VPTAVLPADAPTIRLEHQDFVDRWVIESDPTIDLGPAAGTVAVR